MSDLRLRVALLEWVRRAAAGELDGVRWVDDDLNPEATGFEVTGQPARPTFRGAVLTRFAPPAMVDAARQAVARGEPTALQGLLLVFGEINWLAGARGLLLSYHTPRPELVTHLVEAYGIDGEGHRGDPERLVNLLAQLPRWYPRRGHADRALSLVKRSLHVNPGIALRAPDRAEVFTCHSAAWWARSGLEPGRMRIRDGVLHVTRTEAPADRPEDVHLAPDGDGVPSTTWLRLLPTWATPRTQPRQEA